MIAMRNIFRCSLLVHRDLRLQFQRDEKKSNKSRMVDEWIEQSASAMKTTSKPSEVTAVVPKPALKSKLGTENGKKSRKKLFESL